MTSAPHVLDHPHGKLAKIAWQAAAEGDDLVAALFRVQGRRGERQLDARSIMLCRIAGERIAEVWVAPRDPRVVAEFWS